MCVVGVGWGGGSMITQTPCFINHRRALPWYFSYPHVFSSKLRWDNTVHTAQLSGMGHIRLFLPPGEGGFRVEKNLNLQILVRQNPWHFLNNERKNFTGSANVALEKQ